MKVNFRKANPLWFKDANALTEEELILMKVVFEEGIIPLGDLYGDHNPEFLEWKNKVKDKIKEITQ